MKILNDINLGSSAIDYSICNQIFYESIKNFMVLPQNELSDHCRIITELNLEVSKINTKKDTYNWTKLKKNYKWDKSHARKFTNCLATSNLAINDIKQRIEAGLVKSSGGKIQEIFVNAAKTALDIRKEKKSDHKNSKKWFNRECYILRKETRSLGRQKHKFPFNQFLHEQYRKKLREYKKQCQSSRHSFWKNNFEQIENSLNDPKEFWKKWKQSTEVVKEKSTSNVSGEDWHKHFSTLHGQDENVTDHLNSNITEPPCEKLNKPFTKDELLVIIKKLKKGKATGYDMISNEMLKNAPENILILILNYINLCLEKSLISDSICYDIIHPIFKDGERSNPENYRGICISSAILKLITSLINERIKKKVNEMNVINKNQIGFQEHARTSDHLFALKHVVNKYVTTGKKKLYACFVDLKKAFDSVWHKGIFYKLENLGLHGNLLSLVKCIYKNTKCAVREGDRITQFFSFRKGVRQGCPMSPLLFNLYINDVFEVINNSVDSPIYIKNKQVNALMYADDLVILGQTENELQMCVENLLKYCQRWKLEINTKKTKCIVFNRGNRLCKANISVNNKSIENVKSIKYLGFTISAKNCNLGNTPVDLSIKAKRAIFALNNRIKLSMLPTRLALKIFDTQISPILLYGAEVWAPYCNYNFLNWDKSETEKIHTQFLKRILGCDIHTPNLMVRAELGRRPLLCNAIRRSVLYIKHTGFHDNSLANDTLNEEISSNVELTILYLAQKFTCYFSESTNYKEPKNNLEIKTQVFQYYDEIWKNAINVLSKSDSYNLYKTDIKLEKYTWMVKNIKHRIALSRLRLTSHQLMIEKGRHYRPKLERIERKCPHCLDQIENECHFITNCTLYTSEREDLFAEAQRNSLLFTDIPSDQQKFIFLLSNEDSELLKKLAEYTYKSFIIRAKI